MKILSMEGSIDIVVLGQNKGTQPGETVTSAKNPAFADKQEFTSHIVSLH